MLQEAANRLEAEMQPLIGLLVREAVDFLRYYAC